MKSFLIVLGKFFAYFWAVIFVLSSIGGIIMCAAATDTITLVLCIVFSILFFFIGIAIFYTVSKRSSATVDCNTATSVHTNFSTENMNPSIDVPDRFNQSLTTAPLSTNTHYPKCNCDGCPNQSLCEYGHIIYDEFTKERMTLADKFIMLNTFEMDSFTPNLEPINIISDMQDLYDGKRIDTYPKDIVENTLSYLQEEKKLYLSFGKCGRAYFNYMKMNGPINNLKSVLKNK